MSTNICKPIIHEINWLIEAATCIVESESSRESDLIENSQKFGTTKEEMTQYLSSFNAYQQAVEHEIIPIYRQYPKLEPYFQLVDMELDASSMILPLIMYMREEFSRDLTCEEIDSFINKYYSDFIDESGTQEKQTISGITEIITALGKLKLEDTLKMRMIEFYCDRFTLMKQLKDLLIPCAAICQKYFPLIQQEYEKSAAEMRREDFLTEVLKDVSVIKIEDMKKCEITPIIFGFNQLSLRYTEENWLFYIGIYLNHLTALKRKNKFNDTQMVTDLKAISDATRLKIIHLLANRKMYLQELAQELNLTPATVSHHINILLHSEIVCISVDVEKAKKIFYEVNDAKLIGLGKSIQELV